MMLRALRTVLLAPLFAATLSAANPEELVLVATDGISMPIAEFSEGRVVGGILFDLGEALSASLGRKVRYIALPRNRMLRMLEEGEADGLCYARPEWYGTANLNWTKPLIPSGNVIVTRQGVQVLPVFKDFAGVSVGTVLGYKYPEIENVLGAAFVRDDARTTEYNFRKLSAGRVDYALVDALNLAWRLKVQDPPLALRPETLVLSSFVAQCAFSKLSRVPFPELEAAIQKLLSSRKMDEILKKYR